MDSYRIDSIKSQRMIHQYDHLPLLIQWRFSFAFQRTIIIHWSSLPVVDNCYLLQWTLYPPCWYVLGTSDLVTMLCPIPVVGILTYMSCSMFPCWPFRGVSCCLIFRDATPHPAPPARASRRPQSVSDQWSKISAMCWLMGVASTRSIWEVQYLMSTDGY